MEELLRDVIQQVMEVEMDEELGRERCRMSTVKPPLPTTATVTLRKPSRRQLGEINNKVPRGRKGNYEPKIVTKYDRNTEGMEDEL